MVPNWWAQWRGDDLAQGDLLPGCQVPHFGDDFGKTGVAEVVPVIRANLIVVTQSCDLVNRKVPQVALCPIASLFSIEQTTPHIWKKEEWEKVRMGRREGLYMLASPEHPENNRESFIVDFKQIYSLPLPFSPCARTWPT